MITLYRSSNLSRPLFFFYCYGAHRHLHSFPTRRSSDLPPRSICSSVPSRRLLIEAQIPICGRSEEHTSELQSRVALVCRLLLEKTNKTCHVYSTPACPHDNFSLVASQRPP